MDINFLPLFILNLVEFDERLPSMRFALDCQIPYMGSCVQFKSENLWIECDVWDRWRFELSKLTVMEGDSATLYDIDKCFSVSIKRKKNNRLEFSFSNEINELNKPITQLHSALILSSEDLNRIVNSTENFPIMW